MHILNSVAMCRNCVIAVEGVNFSGNRVNFAGNKLSGLIKFHGLCGHLDTPSNATIHDN